jgi:hypothetical protein
VFVRALTAPAGGVRYERQVSSGGGTNPRWSRANSELLYQSGDQIIAVPFIVKGNAWAHTVAFIQNFFDEVRRRVK